MLDETGDRPMPIWTCWNHWIAVSTDDQTGVMQTLGLSKSQPVTFAQAQEVIDADGHDDSEDGRSLARVYVTPEIEGWTLVFGAWCDPLPQERAAWHEQLGYPIDWDPSTADEEQAEEWRWVAFGLAPEVAAAHGISPLDFDQESQTRGTGVLALTPLAPPPHGRS